LNARLAPAWLNLGRIYGLYSNQALSSNQPDSLGKAIEAYRAVLAIDPGNAEAHHQVALFEQWRGNFAESLKHLNQLPPDDQRTRAAIAIRCADEAALGDAPSALGRADQLLGDPDLAEADINAILPTLRARSETVALRLLEGLDKRGIAMTETRGALAELYERAGDLSAARRQYEISFKSSPKSPVILTNLARVAWKQKDFEGALSYLAHARDLDPSNAGIHFFFGLTCNELHLPSDARKSLEKAVELAPDNPYYNYAIGAIRLQWKETDGAIPYLQKYVAAKPEDARGRLALALAYKSVHQYAKAKNELASIRQNEQTRAGTEYLLAEIATQEGDSDSAIAHFRQVILLEPNLAEGHAALGALLLDKDDLKGAEKETDAAIAIDKENYTANRTLMRLYRAGGDPRLAQQTEVLKKLSEEGEAKIRLLQRTIEVRPW
jgi:tetratricopeptide (TPR) repeat protein